MDGETNPGEEEVEGEFAAADAVVDGSEKPVDKDAEVACPVARARAFLAERFQ